jgi:hypothetical protein
MAAFAMHLLRTVPGLRETSILPDGEHGKRRRASPLRGTADHGDRDFGGTHGGARARAAGIELALGTRRALSLM